MEGDVIDDYGVIDLLAGAVNAGLRKLFSVVTKKDLMEQVRHEVASTHWFWGDIPINTVSQTLKI